MGFRTSLMQKNTEVLVIWKGVPRFPWTLHQVKWKAAECKIKSNKLEKCKLVKCIFRVINCFSKNGVLI